MHIAGFAADESFVCFDFTSELRSRSQAQREPDSVIHKPRGFLRDANSPMNFVTADTVLAVDDLPHGEQPFVETNRGILEDRACLGSKLPRVVRNAALPAVVLLHEDNLRAATARANDAIRPAARYQILPAVRGIVEVENRFLKGLWFACHVSIHSGLASICQLYCYPK